MSAAPAPQLAEPGATASSRSMTAEPLAAFADADETIGSTSTPHSARQAPIEPACNDYASFLSDVVAAVAQHVEPWKQRLAEAGSRWGALGYGVAVLERALARTTAPDVDGLLATFGAAVEHLRRLEAQATAIDPDLAGSPAFRDPQRVADADAALTRLLPPGPDAALALSSFIVTGSNAATLRAVEAVVAEPSARHNPLYMHGPSGSGRTHLLGATANALRGWRAGRVAYVSAGQLAEELAAAVQANTVAQWRARYGSVDVLAVDDVHVLATDPHTARELATLCAGLRERGRQVLLAGDADAAPNGSVGDALRMQIECGLTVSLAAPDRELRARLIAAYFAAARRDVDSDVVSYLAERVESSAHNIAPTAERLLAAADRAGVPLTLPIARSELGRTPARTPLWTVSAGGARSDPFFLDGEKVIWDWPDVSGRVIEELR